MEYRFFYTKIYYVNLLCKLPRIYPYTDYSGASPVYKSNASSGNHYTNGVNEKIDMWWGHLSRDVLFNQMDDNYQDWAGGPAVTSLTGGNANGRHVDDLVVTGTSTTWPNRPTYSTALPQGALNNRQNLKLDGTGSTVTVPLWVMPGATDYYYISASDTASGKAVKITGVSSTGVLSYNGGAIDPNVGGDYKEAETRYSEELGQNVFQAISLLL